MCQPRWASASSLVRETGFRWLRSRSGGHFQVVFIGKRGLNHQRVREIDLETGKRIGEEKKAREDRRVFIGIS